MLQVGIGKSFWGILGRKTGFKGTEEGSESPDVLTTSQLESLTGETQRWKESKRKETNIRKLNS